MRSESLAFPGQTSEFQYRNFPPCILAFVSTVNQPWPSPQASKRTRRRGAPRNIPSSHRQACRARFMNNVHASCGTDNESVDLAGALVLLHTNILDPLGAAHSDNRVDVKDLLKKLKTVLTFAPPLHDRGCPLLVVHFTVHR